MRPKILFQEEQKFTQWWLWVILLAPFLYIFYDFYTSRKVSFINEQNTNDDFVQMASETIVEYGSVIPIILILVVLLLFVLLKLKTEITANAIHIRYYPLFSKTWKWKDVETAEVITYGFVGYGIRISYKYGMVYNVKGNKGLALSFKNGKKIVIGTQKPEELEKIFRGILK